MDLFIETLTGTAFELRVSPFETIMSVKAKIQRLEGELNHRFSKDRLKTVRGGCEERLRKRKSNSGCVHR